MTAVAARILALVVLVIYWVAWSGSPLRAAETREQSGRICLSIRQADAIERTVPDATLQSLAPENASIPLALSPSAVPPTHSSMTCLSVPPEGQLHALTAIKAAYLLAYRSALSFRAEHRWPGDPANLSAPDASVILATYGAYYLVMFSDYVLRKDADGRVELGCGGVEYYWVDLRGDIVRPFSGCVEGRGIPGLPRLPSLPWQ